MKVISLLLSTLLVVEAARRGSSRSGGFKSGARAGGGGFKRRNTETKQKATKEAEAPTQQAPQQVHIHQGGMGMGTTTAWMGLSLMDSIVQEQRRAEMMRNQLEQQKEIGKNQGEIAALKAQLEAQEKKVADMKAEADK